VEAQDKTSVRYMLNNKHKGFWTVSPDDMVTVALELMFVNDVGAVAVLDNEVLVGILTERDCTRKVLLQDKSARTTPIRDVMTRDVYVVRLDQTVNDCMALMSEKNVRHLPVLDNNNRLAGIISIRDAVRYRLSDQAFMIEQLESHIYGRHPAAGR
jgi:signal-transduction protein with cAMP-binding, CBS, and nucleotidyltransferase domain